MAQLFDNNVTKKSKFLLHCRPRLLFHLGHLRMLNILYEILEKGHEVVILIIPYDEHEQNNQTIKNRLQEEINITKAFYSNYLGFNEVQLKIISTFDIPVDKNRLGEIQKKYSELFQLESSKVKKMIDDKNRVWASPNILFVPKCIAAIEEIKPDYIICGQKHEIIADCFEEILNELGNNFISYKFEDFKDLFMKEAMDRTDSVNSFIEVNDNFDFVLQKLYMLKDKNLKSLWLQHFIEFIFNKSPERIKSGINQTQRSESEKEITLNKFLTNVRFQIPYAIEKHIRELKIVWSDEIINNVSDYHKIRIERVAKSAYKEKNLFQITIQRIFSNGKSGSFVFELREFENEDANIISNVSILKFGSYDELINEYHNYVKFISLKKTFAFMSISSKSDAIDNYIGILYQDAHHYLGISKQDRIYTIQKLFKENPISTKSIKVKFDDLFNSHLNEVFYKHGNLVELSSIKKFYNELLPSEYKIEVDSFDKEKNLIHIKQRSGQQTIYTKEIEVTEVNLREKFARVYSTDTHTKIDLKLNGDEALLNVVSRSIRLKLNLQGQIVSTRNEFYDDVLNKINLKREKNKIQISDKIQIIDTISKIDEINSMEFSNFQISTVHGDLHSENVLFGNGNFGIIDYGKMRIKFPSLYDIAYLIADVKIKELPKQFNLKQIFDSETYIYSGNFHSITKHFNPSFNLFNLFEYNNLPKEIKSKGDKNLFYASLTLSYLGMLKFDIEPELKKAALIYSHFSYLKIRK